MIRETKETKIEITDSDKNDIETGDLILNHMLNTLFFYMNRPVKIRGKFDLKHHLWEDAGITIGLFLNPSDKKIARFGTSIMPMDDSLIMVSLDISRPYINFNVNFNNEEGFELLVLREFLWGLARTMNMTMHVIKLNGENPHHITENIFKCLGSALRQALEVSEELKSTKGVL
ncbi:imidazoleglycerol-phosphate dehydratase [Acidiplasma aeolicum]|uniref:Imidazoleglycerol-phosphate dehydratase n=2 Tax=Acidiplasma TaxID=507753 RepID=A0A0Q0XI37_9ARCH|nr:MULTISPECIES: imidazoleglycerol-phosphate dehydratase HisB [Acidiplasma]KPV46887.1 imidazoleglycerol-phosphate dehydratase [Acidiplasma aeolicum]KQB34349.1 imidazoleglycerol-phosphate dehydratase [Acidiplasma cupricumulans]KQB35271.1 imidazoleglycerol-phosphate dehydratase [Acidiplasma aeolicum]